MTGIHFKDAADLEDYIKAEIKAAEDKRGEEVLEWVIERCREVSEGEEDPVEDEVRQAYQERFGS